MRIRRRGADGVRTVCSVHHIYTYVALVWLIIFSCHAGDGGSCFRIVVQRGTYTHMLHRSYPMDIRRHFTFISSLYSS